MFREMRRKARQIPREECIRILQTEPRGVLSLLGDGGYPYGIPMDHWYHEEDGCLYFHSAKAGHKMDAMQGCDKASFCVMDQGFRREGEWALNIKSVIVFGRVELLEDPGQVREMIRWLALKYFPTPEAVEAEILQSLQNVRMFRLVPEHITGKLVNES